MTVYVVDAYAAIDLVRRGYDGGSEWELFAPTLLRSQVLAILHAELVAGRGEARQVLDLAEQACRLPRRLLGDAVLRQTAWAIATEQGWAETCDAEYIALTRLHGEALIAGGDKLRERAAGLVRTETVGDLLGRA
ncbi:MAG: hypothetical protein OEQ47_03825 [Acidimicrobiia bacterium]|nr:hypothetical protein [Acidimicrobiia bacterium]